MDVLCYSNCDAKRARLRDPGMSRAQLLSLNGCFVREFILRLANFDRIIRRTFRPETFISPRSIFFVIDDSQTYAAPSRNEGYKPDEFSYFKDEISLSDQACKSKSFKFFVNQGYKSKLL